MTAAAVLLAVALLVGPDARRVRMRAAGVRTIGRVQSRDRPADDPLAAASTFEVLAACLRSGMAVSTAAAAAARTAPRELARLLERAAALLALGAEPAIAWTTADGSRDPHADALMRLARRSASSGAALADGVAELARKSRDDAGDAARAAAERASVLIAGPLGLCYLPAFLCLGIVPVVAGLASDVLRAGLL